jgi:Carboxypeptidase regulatory-like domain/TonB dependent receptor
MLSLPRFLSRLVALAVLALGVTTAAVAQTGDAEITGLIKDPSGSAVPSASVAITNQDTGVVRTITTDADGRYRFYPLPPGRYSLRVEISGFKTSTLNDIQVNIGTHLEHDISLTVGSVQESIAITAEVPPVDVTHNDVSGVVTNQQMESLPINTRQYLNLALLMPGTSQDSSRTFYNSVQMGGSSHYWSNGFTVDGVTNTWAEMGEPRQNFPKGAVEEFKVNTIQYGADKGLSAGGVISIVTKSGTNQFHGEAFEYARDEIFNHDNAFDKLAEQQIGISKKPFRRNQFGGSFGGPIVKNKLHFYAAFERTQTTDSYTIYTGTTGHQYYSALEGVHTKPIHDQMFNARGDYQISNSQHLFGRYSQEWNLITYNGCGGASMAACYDGQIPRHSLVLGHTWSVAPTIVNEARFQYAYSSYQLGPSGAPIFTQMGVYPPERLAPLQTQLNFPSFSYGFGYADVGVETRWQWKDDLSIVRGNHTIKLGFDVSRIPFGDDAPNQLKGTYTFAHDHVFDPNNPATLAALAASNDATQFTATVPPIYTRADTTVAGLYVQDEWKLRRNLTLNLGLRWDRQFGSFNEQLDPKSLTFNGAPITIPYLGDPSKRGSRKNFGPRVGLAWDIAGNGRDVVRAGYGIYYQNLQTLQNFAELRNLAQCSVLIKNPAFPDPYGGQSTSAYCSTAAPTVTILDPDYRNPYSQQFNLGYSREITHGFLIHLDGAYSRTLRDYRTVDLNYPIDGVRPFPQFARILDHAPIGHAKYKALYVRAEKRFARRYQFLVSYSLASNKDDSPEAQVTNPANYNLDWGPAGADRRHNLVASGSALLPAKITFGAVWTVRSSLPFSALSNTLDVDGIRQYVPGTTRDQGNRNLDLSLVNAYRATQGLGPIAGGIDSSRFNSFDILVTRPVWVKERRRLELALQVFNLFGTQNLGVPNGQLVAGGNTTNATSPSFGKIQGAFNLQQAELSARFAF